MPSFSRSTAELTADAARWLRADARDVVRVKPVERSAGAPGEPAEGAGPSVSRALLDGLGRWRARLGRRRAVVLLRRRLLVALALGVALELIGAATGAGTGTRALLLIAPTVIVLGGAVAALRDRPRVAEVAQLLDHDLGLAERVSTALELDSQSPRAGQPAANSLPALVQAEGAAAVSRSLRSARATLDPAWTERGLLVALVGALVLLLVLPGGGHGAAHRASRGRQVAAAPRAGTRAAPGSPAKRPGVSTPHGGIPRASGGHRAPLRFGSAPAPAGAGRELARGPSAGKPTGGPSPKQLAKGGSGEVAPRSGAGAGQSGASAGAGAGARSGGAPGGQAGRGAGTAPGSHSAAGSPGASRAASGARGGGGAPNAPGKAGSASSSSSSAGAFRGRHAPPGGETAGGAHGSTVQAVRPPAAKPGAAGAGLPIQPGFAPSRSASGSAGSGPPLAGGLGPARGATVGGAGGAGGASFPYIAPSPSSGTGFDNGLLLSYFTPFSPLLTWR